MTQPTPTITVTLHWQGGSGPRSANIIAEDSPPGELLPILAAGCGLPERDPQGAPIRYLLRLGAGGGRPLDSSRPLGAQGVCDGSHLWLSAPRAAAGAPSYCALALPDGGALLVPPSGLVLTRGWLLRALDLLHPEAHARELRLLDAGRSAYRFVSNRPHCALAPAGPGAWQAATDREDVDTLLNGSPLSPRRPAALADGDSLRLGAGGPALSIALL
ncbi:MAG: EsaB/YukD family protein [Chloroflexales bacterium]